MTKSLSQESALVGSIEPSSKKTDECPSKHNLARRAAKRQSSSSMPKVGRNDHCSNSSSQCIDGCNESRAQKENDNSKGKVAGWPKWETVSNQSSESRPGDTYEDDSTIACKRDWSESEDGNAKRVTGEGSDSIHYSAYGGWRQSSPSIHMVDDGSLSNSACWDRLVDGNEKRETGGWPRWPEAMSKTTRQCTGRQNREVLLNRSEGWNTSEDGSTMVCKRGWNESGDGNAKRVTLLDGLDERRQSSPHIHMVDKGGLRNPASWHGSKYENLKRENDGWPRWPVDVTQTTQQCTSHQNRKGCWNQSKGWAIPEDGSTMACKRGWNESGDGKEKSENGGDAFDHVGRDGWKQSSSNIHIVDKGSSSKSSCWDQAHDENVKRENDGWPRWPEAMSKITRQGTSHQKREYADASNAFNHDGHDGCRPSNSNIHMAVDKGSLSKSTSWDRAKDDSAQREIDGWPRWPGAMSKMTGRFPSRQNREVGWPSQGWTASDDKDLQKETIGGDTDLVESGDPWIQQGSVMSTKCDWNTPASWNASKGDSLGIDQRKWDPDFGQTGGDPWKQNSPTLPLRASRRKFGSRPFAHGENSIRRKSKWSGAPDFSDPDASKQPRLRWGSSSSSASERFPSSQIRKGGWNQSWGRIVSEDGDSLKKNNGRITDLDQSDDLWMEHRPKMLPKCDWNKSASWSESGDDFVADQSSWGAGLDQTGRDLWEQPKFGNSFRERIKLSAAPDFGDPNASNQNKHTFSPKIGGKKLFRGRSRIPYRGCGHERYQSNDTYKKGAGSVSPYYRDSSIGRGQRGHQIRQRNDNTFRKHPDRDTDGFWDGKKARYLGHDGEISFEDPWKRRDHLQDTESWRHGSHNDGVQFFQNDASYDRRFHRERCRHHDSFDDGGCPAEDEYKEICHDRRDSNPWNVPKAYKTIVKDSLSHSHLMGDDEGFRDGQQKPHIDDQNVQTTSSPIHFDQNLLIGSPLPSETKRANPNRHCQNPASNPEVEVRDSTTEASTVCVRFSNPFFVQADSSSSKLCSNLSPAIIGQKASTNPEEPKTSSKRLEPDEILNSSTHFANQEDSQATKICDFSRNIIEMMNHSYSISWNTVRSEPNEELKDGMDEKGIRMFKFALAEFVKDILKPAWKEGRLSKEAHKTVVKKVVDKVVGVLGANIPQTPERIDQYLSFAKEKLNKLVQDYLDMFINT